MRDLQTIYLETAHTMFSLVMVLEWKERPLTITLPITTMLQSPTKKILIFSLAYYPKYVGGAEVAIKEITDRISRDDIEFHVLTLRFDTNLPKFSKEGNVVVHRIGITTRDPDMADLRRFPLHYMKAIWQIWGGFAAIALHRKEKFDGIWAMMAHSCGVPAALFNLFYPDVPFVLTLQEGDPPEYIERKMIPFWPLFRRAFRRAAVIQVISTFLGTWARKMGARAPIVLVPNAVNTKHFLQTFPPEELERLREKLGKKAGEQYVITTSRLVKKNAVDIVIRAMRYLPEHVKFLVLGIGPDEAQLRKLAEDEGVALRVLFLGQVGHADLPKYLQISDVFTRPSRSEGMGNSFVEAMAAGIPVVATPVGGITDLLFDPKQNPDKEPTGLFAKVGDPEDTARALREFLENTPLRERCVANARRMVVAQYDWDLIAKNMREKVFAALLA